MDIPEDLDAVGFDKYYVHTLACAEAEVGRRHDIVNSEGMVQKEFSGRSHGFRTKMRLILPPRSGAVLGEAGKTAYLLRLLHERLVELRHCALLHEAGLLSVGALKQALQIRGGDLETLARCKQKGNTHFRRCQVDDMAV